MLDPLEIKADLVISLQTCNLDDFKSILSTPCLHLSQIKDQNNKNLFHELSLSSIPESFEYSFLTLIQVHYFHLYEESALSKLSEDLNQKTLTDGMSPIMLSVLCNKLSLLKQFIKLGGDPNTRNKQDQNLVHLACQHGLFNILVYLKYELDLDIDSLDFYSMSPLSLAVKAGNETIVSALISWGCNIRILDSQGNSLLHIAACAGNKNVAKVLVLRGIDRKIKNLEGLMAFECCEKEEVRKIFEDPACLMEFNPFRPPLRPVRNSYRLFTVYVLIYITRYALVLVFLLPHLAIELASVSICFFIVNFILFLLVSQKDPGYVKRKAGQNLITLYKKTHFDNICTYCECIKSQFTFHCHHCDRCIEGYDHHCPWIRNCVGYKNHSLFLSFLTAGLIDFLYTSTLGLLDYFQLLQRKRRFFNYKTYHTELGLCVTIICMICFLFIMPIWLSQFRKLFNKNQKKFKKILSSSTLVHKSFSMQGLNQNLRN